MASVKRFFEGFCMFCTILLLLAMVSSVVGSMCLLAWVVKPGLFFIGIVVITLFGCAVYGLSLWAKNNG